MFRSRPEKPLPRAELRERGWKGARAFFVLSTGRCGTRTLAHVLDLAEGAAVEHEPIPRLNRQSRAVYEGWESEPRFHADLIEACREDAVYRAYEAGQVYGETANRLTYFAPAIRRVFADAIFIHLVRDPREVVRSGMDRGWYDTNPWDEGRIVPRPGDPYHERWAEMTPFEKCIWFWHETNRFAADFMATLPPGAGMTLRSEGLFSGDLEALEEICRFVGVELPRPKLIRKVLQRKENFQRRRSFPRADAWSAEQRSALERIAGEMMERLGY